MRSAMNKKAVQAFIEDIIEVCKKHGMSISHQDGHGSFIINEYNETNSTWLRQPVLREPQVGDVYSDEVRDIMLLPDDAAVYLATEWGNPEECFLTWDGVLDDERYIFIGNITELIRKNHQ